MARSPVSIVVPTRGDWGLTRHCLSGLRPTLGVRDQVIVVDTDPTGDPVAGLGHRPWAEVIAAQPGQDAIIDGAARARHDLLVLLEPTAVVMGRWLDPLVKAMEENPTVGAVGPCTNGPPGGQAAEGADYGSQRAMRQFARTWCASHRGETSPTEALAGFCLAVRRADHDRPPTAGRLLICWDSFVHQSDVRSGPVLVSACLITKNEESNIAGCLASVLGGFADEVVVYDTGSTDDTVRIARELGATVIEGYWDDDFARARNASLAHCRGEWIAWLDADETLVCDDIGALRQLLVHTKQEIDAWSVPIHNLTGAGVSAEFVHYAARLFRRDGQEWTGRLHEQIVSRRHPGGLRQGVLEIASLRHTGYLQETWRAKSKTERNLRIAAAAVEAAEGDDHGLALLNLARSNFTAGLMEPSFAYCAEALEGSDQPIVRRMALRVAAECLIDLGRTDEALEWTARLRAECINPIQADTTEAKIRLARGEYTAVLECLDRVGAGSRDEDGFNHGIEEFAPPRAEALAGLGRPGEAADVLLASLSQTERLGPHLGQVLEYLEAANRPASELAAVIPTDKAAYFLAQILQLQLGPADTLLDACFTNMTGTTAVLAAAATLAPKLTLERALVWSSRLRAAGHGDACPLVAQAAAEGPALHRARAAAVAYQMFRDERAYRSYQAVAVGTTSVERAQIRDETASLCPELVPLLDRPGVAALG